MTTRSNPCHAEGITTPNEIRTCLGLDTLKELSDYIRQNEDLIASTTNIKPLICERCYGTINLNTMKCEYCGTRFVKDDTEDNIITTFYMDGREIASFYRRDNI